MLNGATYRASGISNVETPREAGPRLIGASGALISVLIGVSASSAVVGALVASSGTNGQTELDTTRLELPFYA